MSRPQPSKWSAGEGELPHELHHSMVGNFGCDRAPKSCYELGRGAIPVRVEVLLPVVQKEVAQPVSADRKVGRKGHRERVRSEHVEVSTFHKSGLPKHPKQLTDTDRHDLSSASFGCGARSLLSDANEVVGCRIVELQHLGQRLEYLHGGVSVPPMLKAQVVVGTDTREQRDLLTAQASRPPDSADPDANILLIPGTSSRAYLQDNVAGAGLELPAEVVALIGQTKWADSQTTAGDTRMRSACRSDVAQDRFECRSQHFIPDTSMKRDVRVRMLRGRAK